MLSFRELGMPLGIFEVIIILSERETQFEVELLSEHEEAILKKKVSLQLAKDKLKASARSSSSK